MTGIAGGFVRTAAFAFPVTMTSTPIPIRVSENPGEGVWPLVTAARERTRELALRLFISIHGAYLSSTRDRHHGPTTPMAATVQTCLHEMKRNFGIACLLLLLVAAVYAGMWLYGRKTARPLYGNFDVDSHCSGGHDIFLELDSSDAYFNCPGHRDRRHIGIVTRTENSATIIDPKGPWARVHWNAGVHTVTFLGNTTTTAPLRIGQVTEHWRTELPKYLPEH